MPRWSKTAVLSRRQKDVQKKGACLGILTIRIIVYLGLFWGPVFMETLMSLFDITRVHHCSLVVQLQTRPATPQASLFVGQIAYLLVGPVQACQCDNAACRKLVANDGSDTVVVCSGKPPRPPPSRPPAPKHTLT